MHAFQFILNNLNVATAFFNPKGELEQYNNLLINLWRLEESFLQQKPYIVQFFEAIREKGIFPEKDDFRSFCNTLENIALNTPEHQNKSNLFLPSGKMLSETQIKSAEGFIIFWEDTTDTLGLTHNLNNQKGIYQRLIDKNHNAIIVVASNGLVDNFNSRFLEMFNLPANILESKLHIKEVLNLLTPFSNLDEEKANLLGNIVSNRTFQKQYTTINNDLFIYGIALPDSSSFVSFSNTAEFKKSLDIPYENVLRFHNDLVVDLNTVIEAPLSNILGFANLLQDEYIGTLNIRQKEYLEKIITKAEYINLELNHKIAFNEFDTVYQNLELLPVDLNIIIAHILHSLKPKIKLKKIAVNLNLAKELHPIISHEELINKSLILIANYLVEQNNPNSELIINIEQNKETTTFSFKDSSKLPLFSEYDLQSRYDLRLALQGLKKLKSTFEHFSKNRNHRTLNINFYNNQQ
ncbi:Sensor protein DivL [Candidatus Hepatincola sp. Av]